MGPEPLRHDTRIYIAGHQGLVGSALWRHFSTRGYTELFGLDSASLDLRDPVATRIFLDEVRPRVVIDAAARVGGIAANVRYPAEFLSDNLRIQLNLVDGAIAAGVERFLFLGSSCIYPKYAPQPITEDALLSGPLEPTNEAYSIAKIAGVRHIGAVRQQYGLPYISAMPANVYGPGDYFDLENSHVLPALIRRFHEAKRDGVGQVTCWGTGEPLREFLYVDDLADACHFLLDNYNGDLPVNVGTGVDVSIAELAQRVADIVGYRGETVWDAGMPDGTPRKLLDVSRMSELGWSAPTMLTDGIKSTYEWFVDNQDDYRS